MKILDAVANGAKKIQEYVNKALSILRIVKAFNAGINAFLKELKTEDEKPTE